VINFRKFEKYEDYVFLQGSKARTKRAELLQHRDKSIRGFSIIFQGLRDYCKQSAFLCLGARTGAENEAAELAGFTGSVGIDLHPVGGDVLQGDWHKLPFADQSFQNVYTNSLDHCFDLEKMGKEILRVMMDDGVFIAQIPDTDEWETTPFKDRKLGFEAMFWNESSEVCQALEKLGFSWERISRHGKNNIYALRKM